MELVRGLHNLRAEHRGCAVTIGTFDGVHVGHVAMIARLREHARRLGVPATLVTFEPTPREYLDPTNAPARLTRLRERLPLFARAGVERCIVLRFDEHLRSVHGAEFVERLLDRRLGARAVMVGHDFRFGYKGEADVEALRAAAPAHGFELDVLAPVMIDGERVSSSGVRTALAAGDLDRAARWLGRRYSMQGRVIEGERLGRKLGFPTANLGMHRRVAPLTGIFAVRVHVGAPHPSSLAAGAGRGSGLPGVASLGTRPTVDGRELLLEAHVFDFDGDLYRRHIEVEFVRRLREERRFESLDALVAQMHEDARAARAALSEG
jgi:riboflavin kinase / FMN adenylyltransferase